VPDPGRVALASSAASKSKGPRRALALCVCFEAVPNLSDAFGFGSLEAFKQVFYLPPVVSFDGLKFRDHCVDLVYPQINGYRDLAYVSV